MTSARRKGGSYIRVSVRVLRLSGGLGCWVGSSYSLVPSVVAGCPFFVALKRYAVVAVVVVAAAHLFTCSSVYQMCVGLSVHLFIVFPDGLGSGICRHPARRSPTCCDARAALALAKAAPRRPRRRRLGPTRRAGTGAKKRIERRLACDNERINGHRQRIVRRLEVPAPTRGFANAGVLLVKREAGSDLPGSGFTNYCYPRCPMSLSSPPPLGWSEACIVIVINDAHIKPRLQLQKSNQGLDVRGRADGAFYRPREKAATGNATAVRDVAIAVAAAPETFANLASNHDCGW